MTEYTEQFHRGRASRLISEILELQAENARLVSELAAANETCERLRKELHEMQKDFFAEQLKNQQLRGQVALLMEAYLNIEAATGDDVVKDLAKLLDAQPVSEMDATSADVPPFPLAVDVNAGFSAEIWDKEYTGEGN